MEIKIKGQIEQVNQLVSKFREMANEFGGTLMISRSNPLSESQKFRTARLDIFFDLDDAKGEVGFRTAVNNLFIEDFIAGKGSPDVSKLRNRGLIIDFGRPKPKRDNVVPLLIADNT